MIGLEDREALFKMCDDRYVKREDCDSRMTNTSEILHQEDTRLAVIEQRLKVNTWLTSAIAAGIIALVIKVFIGG